MRKNEHGVTTIILVIIILIILIFAISAIFLGKKLMTKAKMEDIATNILLIQAKVKTISEKIDIDNGATDLLKGRLINQDEQEDRSILEKLNINEVDSMKRILTKQNLEEWGLENIADDNKYLVDYKTCEIYYIPGIKDKEKNIMYDSNEIITKSKEIGK